MGSYSESMIGAGDRLNRQPTHAEILADMRMRAGRAVAIGANRSSDAPIAAPRYVRCADCDHGLIFARNANGTVKAWFVCGECRGAGTVAA